VLSRLIPWDEISNLYLKNVGVSPTGRPPLSPRVVIGSLVIKHLCNLDDRETVDQISENLNAFNERIVAIKTKFEAKDDGQKPPSALGDDNSGQCGNKGRVIYDATACPQDIAYPTDLDLLSDARVRTEQLIDVPYDPVLHAAKPRTYRQVARKRYLQSAQKKNKSRKEIRRAVGGQLRFLGRNLAAIDRLLDAYPTIPLKPKQYKYMLVAKTLYAQQKEMYVSRTHSIQDRIVGIHQPHVRPIVRGKSQAKVEFGAKIHVSVIDGISFLDELSWDAFNEGIHMMGYVEKYRKRFGCYPKELLADRIYCTRANRAAPKEKGIRLMAKPLGRPSAGSIHVSPGERNPIEGKFGQAKTGYGLNRIKARLRGTSEACIACIFWVLNLVKLAGAALPCLVPKRMTGFSASQMFGAVSQYACRNTRQLFECIQILNPWPLNLKIAS